MTKVRNVRMDDEQWDALLAVAIQRGYPDRSALIRSLVELVETEPVSSKPVVAKYTMALADEAYIDDIDREPFYE